jgi:hypothetical protein
MTDTGQILGILVNSDRYFDYILKLSEAASTAGKSVWIHVLDKGFDLFAAGQFAALSRMTRITACAAGLARPASAGPCQLPAMVKIISAGEFADILRKFDRTVVF